MNKQTHWDENPTGGRDTSPSKQRQDSTETTKAKGPQNYLQVTEKKEQAVEHFLPRIIFRNKVKLKTCLDK